MKDVMTFSLLLMNDKVRVHSSRCTVWLAPYPMYSGGISPMPLALHIWTSELYVVHLTVIFCGPGQTTSIGGTDEYSEDESEHKEHSHIYILR